MFYTIYAELCHKIGRSPSWVAQQLSINKATVTYWKNNPTAKPSNEVVCKIADYFNVSTDYLLGNDYTTTDSELNEYLEELKTRPEMRMLFSLAKGATKDDVEKAVKIIEALRNNE